MNNETLERLRLPGAWVLLGAVGVTMLSGLIRLIIESSGITGSFAWAMTGSGGSFYGITITLMLVAAIALVLTNERTRQGSFPVVLTAMIMVGLGLLFWLIALISGFIDVDNGGIAFAGFLSRAAQGAVLGFFGFFLLKIFNDPTIVPRAQPQQAQYPNPFPPATGGQPGMAQPGYGVVDPAQAYGQDAAAQQQAAYGQQYGTGAQQAYGQDYAAQQAYGQDAAAQQQAAYGQQYGTGAQQAYGQDAAAQQQAAYGQQYGTDAYGQQYGTDAYGQQAAAAQQNEYGQGYDPAQYAPQAYDAQQGADQQAQDAIQNGWYQDQAQPRTGQETPSEGGVEGFFNSGEKTANEAPDQSGGSYGSQYGSGAGYGSDQQGQGGTDNQQNWYGNEGQR